jgi:hypothetical protein
MTPDSTSVHVPPLLVERYNPPDVAARTVVAVVDPAVAASTITLLMDEVPIVLAPVCVHVAPPFAETSTPHPW